MTPENARQGGLMLAKIGALEAAVENISGLLNGDYVITNVSAAKVGADGALGESVQILIGPTDTVNGKTGLQFILSIYQAMLKELQSALDAL